MEIDLQEDVRSKERLERSFALLEFRGVGLNRLLSVQLDTICNGNYSRNYKDFVIAYFYCLLPKRRRSIKPHDIGKKILYFKTAEQRHYNAMNKVVSSHEFIAKNTVSFCNKSKDSDYGGKFIIPGFVELVLASIYVFKHSRLILDYARKYMNQDLGIVFLADVVLQIARFCYVQNFLASFDNLKLLIGDYDRGPISSLFFACAKLSGVRSVVLQHGVVNPPCGYWPLNADVMMVWGEWTRGILNRCGVPMDKMIVVGMPQLSMIDSLVKQKRGRYIVLALSSERQEVDRALVEVFAEFKRMHSNLDDQFLVKLHPGRNPNDYEWVSNQFNLEIVPSDLPINTFWNCADIIISDTSSMLLEGIILGKIVGVIGKSGELKGNGKHLVNDLGVPMVSTKVCFQKLCKLQSLGVDTSVLADSLGEEAIERIQRWILGELSF